jgi:hypothetical protein
MSVVLRPIDRPAATPRIPVVLRVVRVKVDDDGHLTVAIDREPYDPTERQAPRNPAGREALTSILDDITQRVGPVRVEVTESDGTVFTDIATAPAASPAEPETPCRTVSPDPISPGPVSSCGMSGAGFLPGEEVAVAVIVAHQSARADGTTRLRLPPVVLAGRPGRVVLLGRSSGTVAWGKPVDDRVRADGDGPLDDEGGGGG